MLPVRDRFKNLKLIFYILPLATIVGKGHHTTIEVALPLNLNLKGKFEYIIGRYETLKPKDLDLPKGGDIEKILADAQSDAASKLVLVFYRTGTTVLEGYVKFNSKLEDMDVWNDLARGDARLISLFQSLPNYPTKSDIAKLHVKVAQKLLGGPGDTRTFQQKRDFWENK